MCVWTCCLLWVAGKSDLISDEERSKCVEDEVSLTSDVHAGSCHWL